MGSVAGRAIYREQVLFVGTAGVLTLAWKLRHNVRPSVLALSLYLAASALYHAAYFPLSDIGSVAVFRRTALFLGLVAVCQFRFAEPKEWVIALGVALGLLATIIGFPPLYNTSLNLLFLTSVLPLTGQFFPICFGMATVAVVLGDSFTAEVALGLAALFRWRWKALVLFLPVLAVKQWSLPENFVQGGRREMYEALWNFFLSYGDQRIWAVGFGFGSFWAMGQGIQALYNFPAEYGKWYSAHSDVIQTLIETGAVGVALFAWLVVDAFRTERREKKEALALLLVGTLWNFPLQVPGCLAFFVWLTSRPKEPCESSGSTY